jgi:hypothetical protein
MEAGMSASDVAVAELVRQRLTGPPVESAGEAQEKGPNAGTYGSIVIVGGGCYGSYYVRQLGRARAAGALNWSSVLVVDRDPGCKVARELAAGAVTTSGVSVVAAEWTSFFNDYLGAACRDPKGTARDAIVPSPLMPHLMYEWLLSRARAAWPGRVVATKPLQSSPQVPWQRSSPDGTSYVSFAEWICPVNCIEPATCPKTRGPRSWTMPAAIESFVAAERSAGRPLLGPLIFHCTHRAYGVGMFDTATAVRADAFVRAAGTAGSADVLIGTVSHCHGALNVLSIGGVGEQD